VSTKKPIEKRGFTVQEKWIIWGVFCLLVALSTHRVSVFLGLILASAGINLLMKKRRPLLGSTLTVLGMIGLIFSKFLI